MHFFYGIRALLSYFEFQLQASMASEISHTQSKSSASTGSAMDDLMPSSPYYLYAGDNSSLILVTEPLTGDNFHSWFRSMHMALTIKNKLGFVDGSVREPEDGFRSPLYAYWTRCNTVVITRMAVYTWFYGYEYINVETKSHENWFH